RPPLRGAVSLTLLRPLRGLRTVRVEPLGYCPSNTEKPPACAGGFCGSEGIRTPGGLPHAGFQNRCLRPLGHASTRANGRIFYPGQACSGPSCFGGDSTRHETRRSPSSPHTTEFPFTPSERVRAVDPPSTS